MLSGSVFRDDELNNYLDLAISLGQGCKYEYQMLKEVAAFW